MYDDMDKYNLASIVGKLGSIIIHIPIIIPALVQYILYVYACLQLLYAYFATY